MTQRLEDLRQLVERPGPFLTITLPAPSDHADAAHRFGVERKNAVAAIPEEWPDDDVQSLADDLDTLPHDAGASVIVVRPEGGPTFVEFLDADVSHSDVYSGDFPRLVALLEARQRTIAHIVVECDKSGADITAFDGGSIIGRLEVEGDNEHLLHRGHPGGWSQRRFQQRAENAWDDNAKDVADATMALAERIDARLIAVVGPPRASSMVTGELESRVDGRPAGEEVIVATIEAGDEAGIAEEIVRQTSDVSARDTMSVIERAKASAESLHGFSVDEIKTAVTEGRVETLLVWTGLAESSGSSSDDDVIDESIASALRTGADVRVVPRTTVLDRGIGAVMRW